MKLSFRFNIWFVLITLLVAVILVPMAFNFLFLWESGYSNGKTSDWFVLYGNITGGLLGGFFTYLALMLTFNEQRESKKRDMRPKLDIPYQSIEFIDAGEKFNYPDFPIEFNNIGGSIAKNIECSLSIPNYDKVIETLEKNKTKLKMDIIKAETNKVEDYEKNIQGEKSANLILLDDDGTEKSFLGNVYNHYHPEFIGTCLPLSLNHEAKIYYILHSHVGYWINYVAQNRKYTGNGPDEDELFKLVLKVNYSSDIYGDFTDTFLLEWKYIGVLLEDGKSKFQYILKSTKEISTNS